MAGPEDAVDLARLNLAFNEVDASPESISERLTVPSTETVFIAEVAGNVVGFLCLQITRSICLLPFA
jgi:hypothetical protein